jgi:hypothetical protein
VTLGGGFFIGLFVMVMEESDATHHLLLLQAFISQGVVHKQPLLFARPMKEPRSFLGALPAPLSSLKEESCQRAIEEQVLVYVLWTNVFYSVLISVAPFFIFVLSWICYCAG